MKIATYNVNGVNGRLPTLLSPDLASRLTATGVDAEFRGRDKASDHAPVWIEID